MLFRLLTIIFIFIAAVFIPAIVLHVKEVVLWRWALKKNLNQLGKDKHLFRPAKKEALAIVEKQCTKLFLASTPELTPFSDLNEFIISISRCFHPEALRPELQVTPGHILFCLERSIEHFDLILSRPGFSQLSLVNIKTIKQLRGLYQTIRTPGVSSKISNRTRLYLLKNITQLFLTKYLIIDLTLFFGKLVVEVYDEKLITLVGDKKTELEETLRELSLIKNIEPSEYPQELLEIRNSIVGMPSVLMSNPTFARWKTAVADAAGVVAANHFPDSGTPMEEAMIGPLLLRSGVWITKLGNGEIYPVAGRLFKIRLETLFQAKSISDALVPAPVKKIIINTQKTYGWIKWPINVYMLASKGVFWKMAIDAGWFAGRKAILVVLFGKSFDKAVSELEIVYLMSKNHEKMR